MRVCEKKYKEFTERTEALPILRTQGGKKMRPAIDSPILLASCVALAVTAGCTKSAGQTAAPSAAAAVSVSAADRQTALSTFAGNCAVCHGADGRGDGPGGKYLVPHPRNFTDAKWQESVSDAHIEQVILYGGAAAGLSPAMPAHPEFLGKPALVAALREHIRGLKGQ